VDTSDDRPRRTTLIAGLCKKGRDGCAAPLCDGTAFAVETRATKVFGPQSLKTSSKRRLLISERRACEAALTLRPPWPCFKTKGGPSNLLQPFGGLGSDDVVRHLFDGGVLLRSLENLRSVTHHDEAVADHEGMIEVMSDQHA
jgi:hypothetical protein